ncbi:D-hexose-6-phosphate mutarotase [Reinekea sp.]|jgi:glucose-6-phosphate 1-epimerase|uniref:D-hexose-6-phosphate mutarotase n=1 Tax=Reinekea sp. TaxID=1970455 RepID=UPI0039892EA9
MNLTALSPNVSLDQYQNLRCLRIQNNSACATIFLQGAHLTEYSPTGSTNLLFVSAQETYSENEAIRGGVPICWPWFGPHANETNAPAHGFVRTREWQYEIVKESPDRTDIQFSFETTGDDLGFPFRARAELLISIGDTLVMSMTTKNLGEDAIPLSQAMHTYFACDDVEQVRLTGLTGRQTLNKLTNTSISFPKDFSFNQEVDWVVLDDGQPLLITGTGKDAIQLTRLGSRSVVVWNPWQEKAKTLSNFHPSEFRKMFCVETTNAADDARLLKPKQGHSMVMELTRLVSQ